MATKASARRSTVQSKWAMSRRSICTSLPLDADLLLLSRPGLNLHVFLDHFFRQGSCSISAMAAVLDQSYHGNFRILHRRIGNKPGMVAVEIGQLFALYVGAALHLHNLCRPGLAGNFHYA